MSIKFNPTGHLNITADPLDLPEQVQEKTVVSGAMVRCKNLDLTYAGIAKTRKGSRLKTDMPCTKRITNIELVGSDRYEFGGDQIFYNETSIATGLSYKTWDSIVGKAFNDPVQSAFAVNSVNRKRIQSGVVYEWGITPPTVAPIVAPYVDYSVTFEWELTYIVTSGYQFTQDVTSEYNCLFDWEVATLDGTTLYPHLENVSTFYVEANGTVTTDKYLVCYTYCRKLGDLLISESNPSPQADTNITNVLYVDWTIPSDSQVTHVRIYRSLANFADLYYAGEFDISTEWAAVTTTDDALGSLVETDHDRPPLGDVVSGPDFNGVMFMGKDNLLYFSKPKQPEYWPALYNVELGNDQYSIQAISILAGQAYAATKHEIYQISGTGAESFFPLPMAAITGTHAKKVFLPVKGYGMFHLGWDGLYLYTGSTDIKISQTFSSLWNNETKHSIPPINKNYISNCLMVKDENKIWFGYPSGVSQYCTNFLVMELESNLLQGLTSKIQYYTYPFEITALHVDANKSELIAVDTDGYVRVIDYEGTTTDSDTDIEWEIESKSFGALRKYFPRWARYDLKLVNGATATGKILLNDNVKQSHPITVSRNIKKRLIDGITGDRISIRITGTGPVEFHSAEIE